MGMMDNIKGKMGDMSDEARARFDELQSKEQTGDITDNERGELQDLRDRFGME